MSWASATLGELCEIRVGRTPARANSALWGEGEPWLSIADMNQGALITATKEQITSAGAASGRQIPAGTVLLSFKLSIGKVAISGIPLYTNEAIAALPIRRDAQLDPQYLLRALQSLSLADSANRAAMGATLNRAALESIHIPLPPLPEQKRIAAILDRADCLLARRRQSLALLDELARSAFLAMFGNPLHNPHGLRRSSVGSLAEVMTGSSPPRSDTNNFGDTIEWIKSDNLGPEIATIATEWLSEVGRSRARVAPPGSVLVTCIAGSPTSIGKASIVDRAVAFNQQINAVLPSDAIDPAFLLGQLKVAPTLVRAKSTQGMKGLVNKSAFSAIELLVPPLEDQRAYAARVEAIQAKRRAHQASMERLSSLFDACQYRAFSGELSPLTS